MDFEQILNNCGVDNENPEEVLSCLASLSKMYSSDEMTEIYNYALQYFKSPEVLIEIIKLAIEGKNATTLPILTDLLLKNIQDSDNTDAWINLKVLCAKSISKFKDSSSVGALLYCLNNKNVNYKIRLACADALGRIGDRYAVSPLIKVVEDEEEKSVYVKESATFALGLLGDPSAIDPLVSIMEAKQGLWDKFSFLKEKIIEVLGRLSINNEKVLKVFKMSLMDSSPMVRINTIEALMNSEYEEAPELIRSALQDENEEVQRNAIIALYNILGRDVLDEVISLPGYSEFLKNEAKSLIEEYEEGVE